MHNPATISVCKNPRRLNCLRFDISSSSLSNYFVDWNGRYVVSLLFVGIDLCTSFSILNISKTQINLASFKIACAEL